MKYKVGQKVRVRKDLKANEKYKMHYVDDEMLKFAGKIVEIIDERGFYYKIKEDKNEYGWEEDMLEPLEYTYEDLCKSPVGTKITFENEMILIKEQDRYSNLGFLRFEHDLEGFKDNTIRCDTIGNFGKIIKIEEPSYTTVYEAKPDVLDEVEKEYLRNIIKPFRDRVDYVEKVRINSNEDYINIIIDNGDEEIDFPVFKAGTMYKGMEVGKEYSIKELGL